MTKSFKMVLLEALLELDGLHQPMSLERLTTRSREVMDRSRPLLTHLPSETRLEHGTSGAWARYWRENPVKAWTGSNRTNSTNVFFKLDGAHFVSRRLSRPRWRRP